MRPHLKSVKLQQQADSGGAEPWQTEVPNREKYQRIHPEEGKGELGTNVFGAKTVATNCKVDGRLCAISEAQSCLLSAAPNSSW
jgi:hypothetical protein